MNPIIEWLQSEEGSAWSADYHSGSLNGGNATRHSHGAFASFKSDHEGCYWNERYGGYVDCEPSNLSHSHTDKIILAEIKKYGMNGICSTTVGTSGSSPSA